MRKEDLEKLMEDYNPETIEFKNELLRGMNYLCSFGLQNDLRQHVAEDVSLIKYGSVKTAEEVRKGEKC